MTHRDRYPMKFVDRLIAQSPWHIHRLKAKDSTGRWAYYFVYVPPGRSESFSKAIEDYGTVIASCYGEMPDEATKKLLKDKYGIDM